MEAVIFCGIQASAKMAYYKERFFDTRQVPVPALLGTHKRLEMPPPAEGFDELYVVRVTPEGEFGRAGILHSSVASPYMAVAFRRVYAASSYSSRRQAREPSTRPLGVPASSWW